MAVELEAGRLGDELLEAFGLDAEELRRGPRSGSTDLRTKLADARLHGLVLAVGGVFVRTQMRIEVELADELRALLERRK